MPLVKHLPFVVRQVSDRFLFVPNLDCYFWRFPTQLALHVANSLCAVCVLALGMQPPLPPATARELVRFYLHGDPVAADLRCSLFVAAALSYKRDSVLRPFPPRYVNGDSKDFEALVSKKIYRKGTMSVTVQPFVIKGRCFKGGDWAGLACLRCADCADPGRPDRLSRLSSSWQM